MTNLEFMKEKNFPLRVMLINLERDLIKQRDLKEGGEQLNKYLLALKIINEQLKKDEAPKKDKKEDAKDKNESTSQEKVGFFSGLARAVKKIGKKGKLFADLTKYFMGGDVKFKAAWNKYIYENPQMSALTANIEKNKELALKLKDLEIIDQQINNLEKEMAHANKVRYFLEQRERIVNKIIELNPSENRNNLD